AAEKADLFRLLYRDLEAVNRERILGANIDEALVRADGVAGDGHALEHAVGIAFENAPVHESSGGALIRIADHVFLGSGRLGDGGPFEAGRIAGAAPAAQSAFDDSVDH